MSKATERRLNKIAAKQNNGYKVFYKRDDGTYTDTGRERIYTQTEIDKVGAQGVQVIVVEYVKRWRNTDELKNTWTA